MFRFGSPQLGQGKSTSQEMCLPFHSDSLERFQPNGVAVAVDHPDLVPCVVHHHEVTPTRGRSTIMLARRRFVKLRRKGRRVHASPTLAKSASGSTSRSGCHQQLAKDRRQAVPLNQGPSQRFVLLNRPIPQGVCQSVAINEIHPQGQDAKPTAAGLADDPISRMPTAKLLTSSLPES